ncbi:MAG: hypothetical protein JWO91_874, partial [Acidobacteriaceae bacterium]|nr:hypothetical protein [Acidobacteriaceae bacterium]
MSRKKSRLSVLVNLHCRPRLVGRMADILKRTLHTLWPSRDAQLTTMPDGLMRKQDPLALRNDPHQILLDVFGIVVLRQFESAGDSVNMRIDYNADA